MQKSNRHIVFLLAGIAVFGGMRCENQKNATVTGALFDRSPGTLQEYRVDPDSIGIQTLYKGRIGNVTTFLAGTYQTAEAFCVLKFSKPGQTIIDSLQTAILTITVNKSWPEGEFGFALYPTHSDWADSMLIEPDDFLTGLGEPIEVVADTASTLSSLVFTIPREIIADWGTYGSFLMKNSDTGSGMVMLSSDNSLSPPSLDLISRNVKAGLDTTTIRSREGTYFLSTGVTGGEPVIANGDATGYVLTVNIPEFIPPPTPVHGCNLTFTLGEHLFTSTGMTVMLHRLTEPFTTFEDATTDFLSSIQIPIRADSTVYTVDISSFVDSWYNFGETNHGILVQPLDIGTAPDYAVLVPGDSLIIRYSTLPEVK